MRNGSGSSVSHHSRTALVAVFAVIVFAWIALDRVTKVVCDANQPGTVLVDNVLNLFSFVLVHNTGAAWGLFGDSTIILGVFSLLVSLFIVVLLLWLLRVGRVNMLDCISLALVCGGGLGNAWDRLTMGYVVDFINTTFMSFPVFNVADIGVTCGVAMFLVSFLFLHGKDEVDGA